MGREGPEDCAADLIPRLQHPRTANAAIFTRALDREGLYGTRVVAEVGPLNRLSYADNVVTGF
ncbi:MAG TPA: hypothetical protein EYP85_12175 [Armatimonadetes bacterium]|nr:hypothetical protein [Armatimonadota bacterium]